MSCTEALLEDRSWFRTLLFLIRSASSTGSSSSIRSTEEASIKLPSKSTIRRHTNRLSSVFLRGSTSSAGSMARTAGLRSSLSIHTRKGSSMSHCLHYSPCMCTGCMLSLRDIRLLMHYLLFYRIHNSLCFMALVENKLDSLDYNRKSAPHCGVWRTRAWGGAEWCLVVCWMHSIANCNIWFRSAVQTMTKQSCFNSL